MAGPIQNFVFETVPFKNGLFNEAEIIEGTEGQVEVITNHSPLEEGEPDHMNLGFDNSFWFKWIAPETGEFIFETYTPRNFGYMISIYEGSISDGLHFHNGDSNRLGASYKQIIRTKILAKSGVEYFIAIASDDDFWESGSYVHELFWSQRVIANDDFHRRMKLQGVSGSVMGDCSSSTYDLIDESFIFFDNGSFGFPVWYEWQAPVSGIVNFEVSSDRNKLRVLKQSESGQLELLGETLTAPYETDSPEDANYLKMQVDIGQRYIFQMSAFQYISGGFVLKWEYDEIFPSNTSSRDPLEIFEQQGSLDGLMMITTADVSEHEIDGLPRETSAWYQWESDFQGDVEFLVSGESEGFIIDVWLIDQDNSNVISINDQDLNKTQNFVFYSNNNEVYLIGVANSNNQPVEFTLNWKPINSAPKNHHWVFDMDFSGRNILSFFSSKPGMYCLQKSNDLLDWHTVKNFIVDGFPFEWEMPVNNEDSTSMFYRVSGF